MSSSLVHAKQRMFKKKKPFNSKATITLPNCQQRLPLLIFNFQTFDQNINRTQFESIMQTVVTFSFSLSQLHFLFFFSRSSTGSCFYLFRVSFSFNSSHTYQYHNLNFYLYPPSVLYFLSHSFPSSSFLSS